MKKKLLTMVLSLGLSVALVACGTAGTANSGNGNTAGRNTSEGSTAGESTEANGDISVILVTMDGLDSHWVNVDRGAQDAAAELGISYQWMAPDRKDTALQIEILNNAIAAQPDAIIVAAVDPEAIVATLQSAEDAGIQVIYADSTANFEAAAQFTTDNYEAAKQAGEAMIEGLQEKGITSGDIGIVAFSNATQTSVDREQGFRDALEGSDYTILETQIGDSEVAASQRAAENFISQGVVGVYGNNEPGAVGVGNAVAANPNWDGVGIGFDASSVTLDLVENGSLFAVIAQNPYQMGFGAVQAAVALVNGESLTETSVDTGAQVVKTDNVDDFRN